MRFFCVLNLFLFFVSQNAYASKVCGEVIQITGKVEVLRAQAGEDLNRVAIRIEAPYSILCTDVLVTQAGSRAKVKLANGLITLSPNSRISIAKVVKGSQTPSLLNLTYGKMRTFFDGKKNEQKSKDNQTQFKVKTPSAVVGVRGTDFYVGYDPNKEITKQATLKGEVEVEQIKTKNKVIVKGGEQVDVAIADKVTKAETQESLQDVVSKELATPILIVKPIEKETIIQIRQTSPLVKEDIEFKSTEAVAILGEPEKWIPPTDEIPGDLKDIKNEF
ncbi:MAG: FecR family protein [Bdellovibrionota bacterium]